jgi:hypothetical protein
MRHWLCVLLLTLLPLQFSWGAVAGYCTHESSAQAKHLGHHQHEHGKAAAEAAGDAGDADAGHTSQRDDGRASATIDPDCGHCHGLGVGVLMPMAPMTGPLQTRGDAPRSVDILTLRTAAPPDRPQWPPLA